MLEDIAVLTGGVVISEKSVWAWKKQNWRKLGTAKKVQITKENTTIIDGAGSEEQIKAVLHRFAHKLTMQLLTTTKKSCKNVWLIAGGVAVIKVALQLKLKMKEKKARVEDALHSTRAAVEEG